MDAPFFKNKKLFIILTHLAVWTLLCAVPYLFNTGNDIRLWVIIKRSWLPLAFSAVIFYVNYFFLVERLFFNKKNGQFLLVNLLMVIVAYNGNIFIKGMFPLTSTVEATDAEDLSRIARIHELVRFSSILSFLLAIISSVLLKMTRKWLTAEAEKQQIEKMRLESELNHLRYQLQPHFFFNSLNNIYALIDKSPEVAKAAVHSMGKLMRYLLYETANEKIRLVNEIEFLIKYIQLMELRLTKNITVEYDFPTLNNDTEIAPLLFIPLIENAFKHGILVNGSGIIYFKMNIEGDTLSFTSANPNVPQDNSDQSGSGIGLDNLRKRLELIYPGQYTFSSFIENGLFVTTLAINFE